MARAGVRIAIGSDFDPKGFLAAEARSARFAEKQLAMSGTAAGAWVAAGQNMMTFGTRVEGVGRQMTATGGSLTRNVTLPLVAIGGGAIAASVQFESAFAGVRKTVEMTEPEFAKLRQGIRDMAMELPASREEIAGVAEAAGQLGIQNDSILEFTRVMVDLGESTNLSATEGATALARFANVTQMSQDEFSNLGSSIVALGNNMATTEAEITEFALRIAGAGKQVGLTEPQILAIGGALSSVGIDAEAGGTAISKTMIAIASSVAGAGLSAKDYAREFGVSMKDAESKVAENREGLELWATTAGVSADEFVKAWESDPAEALNSVVVGLGEMDEAGGSTLLQLEKLGITEVRQRDALLRAAGAGDLLTQALKVSGDAWTENSALADEAAQRYATTESKLNILKNKVTDVGVTLGDTLVPAMTEALDAAGPILERIRGMAEAFSELEPAQQQQIIKWTAIAAAAGPALSVLGNATIVLGGVIKTAGALGVTLGKLGTMAGGITTTTTALTGLSGVAGVGLTASGVGAALALGLMTGELINQIPAVQGWQESTGEAIATNEGLQNAILGSDGKLFGLNVTAWEGAEATDYLTDKWKKWGIELDANGVPTAKGNAQLEVMNARQRDVAASTREMTSASSEYRNELVLVQDEQRASVDADLGLERATLRLEDAQANYTAVLADYPASSHEAREAALGLKEAELGVEDAAVRAKDAQEDLSEAQANLPLPNSTSAQAWMDYYQAIGDKANYAAAKANAANAALVGGVAKSATGGRNIPVYGSGAHVTAPHLAWVGDEEELIFPLGDKRFADQYLPMLLASLDVGGTSRPARSQASGSYTPARSLTLAAGAIQIILAPGTSAETQKAAGDGVLAALAREYQRS